MPQTVSEHKLVFFQLMKSHADNKAQLKYIIILLKRVILKCASQTVLWSIVSSLLFFPKDPKFQDKKIKNW